MLGRKSNAVSGICIAAIILLATAPMSTYAIITPAGIITHPPHVQVFLDVPVLVNPQPLPPGKTSAMTARSNVSLIMRLSGSADALNGTIVINRNGNTGIPNAAPQPPTVTTVEACTAVAKGGIFLHSSTNHSNTFDNIFLVVTAFEPPDPCIAGLQGYELLIQWQVYNYTVRLTAIPPITSTVAQTTLQWTGQPAPGSTISVIVQSSSATSPQPT